MMVVTLLEPDLEGLRTALHEFAQKADAFEVRFDAFDTLPEPQRVRELTKRPLIATCRRPPDGGSYRGGEEERLSLLERAHASGFDYVDVEAGTNLPVPDDHLIRSVHDLERAATAEEVVARGKTLARNGSVFKFAGRVQTFADNLELLKATRRLQTENLSAAVMGIGAYPRALSHLIGSHLVYGAGRTAAPFQPPLEAIRGTLAHWGNPPASTDLYLVVGDPIDHSLSPRLHNAAFAELSLPAAYGALKVSDQKDLARLLDAASELGLRGLSVTSPLKELAYDLCPRRTAEADRAQAVNCIQLQGDRVMGHNTDGLGAAEVLKRLVGLGSRPSILVVGTGGAARGILPHLRESHATVAGRSPEKLSVFAKEFDVPALPLASARDQLPKFDVVVNATGAGDPIALAGYAGRIFDLHYGPEPTPWERYAKEHSLPFAGGRELLLRQGVPAFEWWTGRRAPVAAMARAVGVAA